MPQMEWRPTGKPVSALVMNDPGQSRRLIQADRALGCGKNVAAVEKALLWIAMAQPGPQKPGKPKRLLK